MTIYTIDKQTYTLEELNILYHTELQTKQYSEEINKISNKHSVNY